MQFLWVNHNLLSAQFPQPNKLIMMEECDQKCDIFTRFIADLTCILKDAIQHVSTNSSASSSVFPFRKTGLFTLTPRGVTLYLVC